MKILIAPLLSLSLLPFVPSSAPPVLRQDPASQPDPAFDEDRAAVERAMQDYVEAFYEAKPELIERGVAAGLKKMGYWRASEQEEYRGPLTMDFDAARELARTWNADGSRGDDLTYAIEIYEVADKTACGKLSADWGIDYMQLAKQDGAWKIHHVLWQSHPPKR